MQCANKMFRPIFAGYAIKAVQKTSARPLLTVISSFRHHSRSLTSTPARFAQDDSKSGPQIDPGEFARTDKTVRIKHPEEHELPRQPIVQGRGGKHFNRTLSQFTLEGKVAVVTGGARGLGLVMAQALVESGADVALVDFDKEEAEKRAKILVEQFQKENADSEELPKVTAHFSDVANPDSVNAAIAEVLDAHGKIDSLVTSAGFTENFDAISYPYDRMQKLWGVNVDGTYLFAVGVAKHLMLRKSPGSIVMIGSMSGSIVNVPQPQTPYCVSKAAVRHLAASLAVEWAEHDIRVNCISPGYMLTALTRKILEEKPELKKKWISLIPTGRMGNPEDLMGAVTFLLSDASKYVTGADLRVDGGYTLT